MSLMSDLKILYHMALRPIRGKSHAERLESFYSGQAEAYDDFRKRLLHGREGLWQKIGPQPGATWVDMGGGTGANLEFFGPDILKLKKIYVVDLAGSLLKVARQRAEKNQWSHVETVEADATRWQPSEGQVDVVTFSYSLTMIPDWFAAIDNALLMLKPGGMIGVVDFYVSRKHPDEDLKRHRWSTRSFWPIWFANDNVYPSSEHLPYLRYRCHTQWLSENRAKVPYLPLVRTPYYQFIGLKKP
jgi:S-adenosylmethionine-diacylgycerolhomoserine-N-methlytransferase